MKEEEAEEEKEVEKPLLLKTPPSPHKKGLNILPLRASFGGPTTQGKTVPVSPLRSKEL